MKFKTILIMDDEVMILDLLKGFLVDLGYKVYCTSNGKDAIEMYKKKKPNLVILDLNIIGGMGGKECSECLMSIDKDVKVLIVTGSSIELPYPYEYIGKPFNLEKLREIIFELIERKA